MTVDRPSAATPEEVLDAMLAETFTAGARDDFRNGYELDFSRQEILDLGRRYMDAAYEDAAKVVEGTTAHGASNLMYPTSPPRVACAAPGCYAGWPHDVDDPANAIRALIGGGE